jgi:hypothetical protein
MGIDTVHTQPCPVESDLKVCAVHTLKTFLHRKIIEQTIPDRIERWWWWLFNGHKNLQLYHYFMHTSLLKCAILDLILQRLTFQDLDQNVGRKSRRIPHMSKSRHMLIRVS